jgi:preprotein translocase subunit SecA
MKMNNILNVFRNNKNKKKIISEIKEQSLVLQTETKEELELRIEKLKLRAKKENLNEILADWFAITQEMSFRTLGLKHFETQLLAGIFLHEGNIVEMKTGEGKTLASTLPLTLNALTKKGAHLITVNEYLAERDQKFMGKLYSALGLTSGLSIPSYSRDEKRKSYSKDITYVTNSEVVFDFLKDSTSYSINDLVLRDFNYCLIDEVDSILIDDSRTPLILSESTGRVKNEMKLYIAHQVATQLKPNIHFKVDLKTRQVNIEFEGLQKIKELLKQEDLFNPMTSCMLEILNSLQAIYLQARDKQYMIQDNKIAIIDETSGRVMSDRRWSQGLHEAVEVKEKLEIGDESAVKASMTYQNFFTIYEKMSGMSGTVKTSAKEFKEIYKLNVVEVPTEKPMIRKDKQDVVVSSEEIKMKEIINIVRECFIKGQPILIGTLDVKKSEKIADLLKIERIPYQLLNAKPENVARESEIVALAGKRGAVTIATNMAGRGTDIILGGNPVYNSKEKLRKLLLTRKTGKDILSTFSFEDSKEYLSFEEQIENIYSEYNENSNLNNLEIDLKTLPYSLENCLPSFKKLYNFLYQEEQKICQKENAFVKELGGLFVLGTERGSSRRIDNQLRGRAGRQGDPGTSVFYISFDDDLLKVYGNLQTAKVLAGESDLQNPFLTRGIAKAQERVENQFFDGRKVVFEYDDILNEQRKKFFKTRQNLLLSTNSINQFVALTEAFTDLLFRKESIQPPIKANPKLAEMKKYYEFENWVGPYSSITSTDLPKSIGIGLNHYNEIWISTDLRNSEMNNYNFKKLDNLILENVLKVMDTAWTEHLKRMEYTRQTVNWLAYGQQNPLLIYNNRCVDSYGTLWEQIRYSMIYYFLTDSIVK